MKKFFITLFVLFAFGLTFAQEKDSTNIKEPEQNWDQEENLIKGVKSFGLFANFDLKFSEIDKKFCVLTGGSGGVLLNKNIGVGFGGSSLISDVSDGNPFGTTYRLEVDYGGLVLEYINNSHKSIHFTIQTLIGGGNVSYADRNYFSSDNYAYTKDVFFIIEPAINAEFNLTKFFKMGLGVSYRSVFGVNTEFVVRNENTGLVYTKLLRDSNISGISANLDFKFVISDFKIFKQVIDSFKGVEW